MMRGPASMVLWAVLATGCHRVAPPPASPHAVSYEARGTIRKIDPAKPSAVIAHDAIPGYMEAMTMELDVSAAPELAGLQPGDVVTFRLSVDEARSWIDRLQKVGTTELPAPEPPAPETAHGAPVPDCALVDSSGRAFHVADFRGQTLVVSFLFTRCPLPDFCPRLSSRLAELSKSLSGTGEGWHLLSISFDPAYDDAEHLAAYAARFSADPARWTFATGEEAEVLRFGAAFGLAVRRTEAGFEHNLRTVVIDPAGRVQRVFAGNTWTTAELAQEVRKAGGQP